MRCKRCGKELEDGQLFCDQCLTPVQIVPDYNPLEELPSVHIEDLDGEEAGDKIGKKREREWRNSRKRRVIFVLAVVILLISLFTGVFIKNYFSSEYQFKRAVKLYEENEKERAEEFLKKALKLDGKNAEAGFLLAQIYKEREDYESAETVYMGMLKAMPEEKEAYIQLIEFYQNLGKTEELNLVLKEAEKNGFAEELEHYRPKVPVANYESGKYENELEIRFKAGTNEEIYYTLDGTEPSPSSSRKYHYAINLKKGTHQIRAIAVDEAGIISSVAEYQYEITIGKPEPPSVLPISGTYYESQTVEIYVPDGCEVYYTLDGTEPTVDSKRYTEPFSMPEGNHILSVVAVNSYQMYSDVVSYSYILELPNAYDYPAALNLLYRKLIAEGTMLDIYGNCPDGGIMTFEYEAEVNFDGVNYYLVNSAHIVDNAMIPRKYYYAINAKTGEITDAVRNDASEYELLW